MASISSSRAFEPAAILKGHGRCLNSATLARAGQQAEQPAAGTRRTHRPGESVKGYSVHDVRTPFLA